MPLSRRHCPLRGARPAHLHPHGLTVAPPKCHLFAPQGAHLVQQYPQLAPIPCAGGLIACGHALSSDPKEAAVVFAPPPMCIASLRALRPVLSSA
eukprot:757870-Amphidinium_carterae.1